MAKITMPKFSDTMEEGTVVRWLKRIGEVIARGDVLAEIETDKASMEMESSENGVLAQIYVEEGEKVAVGQQIAFIQVEGGSEGSGTLTQVEPPKCPQSQNQPMMTDPTPADLRQIRITTRETRKQQSPIKHTAKTESSGRIKASPWARTIAQRMQVDLSLLRGSGPEGRILYRDVISASSPTEAETKSNLLATAPSSENTLIPISSMRRLIAQRMVESKTQIPHFYLQLEADAGPLLQLRDQINIALVESNETQLSINDMVLKATALTLTQVPQVNASYKEEGILRYGRINLGFAVSMDEGLITPVIRNAESKGLQQISLEARDLIERARQKRLRPDEYQDGTFTVSNLGALGIDSFQAVINPPQAAILAVGSIVKKPVVTDHDRIEVGSRLILNLSCDHRVVDGNVGAEFLHKLRRLLEQPAVMLL